MNLVRFLAVPDALFTFESNPSTPIPWKQKIEANISDEEMQGSMASVD
jgi:hypothetical protein